MDTLLKILLGAFLAMAGHLIAERAKDARRRSELLAVVAAHASALRDVCRWAEQHKIVDSSQVERLAAFIERFYMAHPECILAAKSKSGRNALTQFYVSVCAIQDLLKLYRAQAAAATNPNALGPGNYESLAREIDALLKVVTAS